jgi:hypothetical protein
MVTSRGVVLVERDGFLGGNATAALVMPLMSFHTQCAGSIAFEPIDIASWDHGTGDPVVAGVVRACSRDWCRPGRP